MSSPFSKYHTSLQSSLILRILSIRKAAAIRMALVLIGYIIAFIVMAYRTKADRVLSVDVTDAVIFGASAK